MSTTQQPIDDGGRAFPSLDAYGPKGMSLRDWFAGMAMQGLLSNPEVIDPDMKDLATDSFAVADAMIEARKKDYIIDRGEDK
jgi:hypothetical protein